MKRVTESRDCGISRSVISVQCSVFSLITGLLITDLLGAAPAGFPPLPPPVQRSAAILAAASNSIPAAPIPPSPAALPTPHGPTRPIAEQREEKLCDRRIIYPSVHQTKTGFTILFENIQATNFCTLQVKQDGKWQDFIPDGKWIPSPTVWVQVTNRLEYRLLVPITPKRKGE